MAERRAPRQRDADRRSTYPAGPPAPSRLRPGPRRARSGPARRWSSPTPTPAPAAGRTAPAAPRHGADRPSAGCRSPARPRCRPGSRARDSRSTTWRSMSAPLTPFQRGSSTPNTRADIAQPGGRQQRVAQRVRPHVAVGVTGAAVGVGEQQTRPASTAARVRSGARRCPHRPVAARSPAHDRLGQQQIQLGGDLERQRVAVDHLHLAADVARRATRRR